MSSDTHRFDVAILGSGLAGATLGAILARHGVSVVMLEAGSHPRFAIGESVVPEFGALTNVLAGEFDVPELAHLSNFQQVRHHVSANCGKKRNFTFLHHTDGGEPKRDDWCQFQTMTHPLGPDTHMYRPDLDAWLTVLAVKYGVEFRERSPIVDPEADVELGDELVRVTAGGRTVEARFLVDGTGFRSVIARKLGLREEPTQTTDSRTIFTHMVGVRSVEEVLEPGSAVPVPSPPHQGTLHHLFDGGWFWVIPFDNHDRAVNPVCSVGLTLDRGKFPDNDLDAQQEFESFVARFPAVKRQLEGGRAVRSWVKTSRMQYQSSKLTGPRWCLLPHSGAFCDPLFSGGMIMTMLGVRVIAKTLLEALPKDDPTPAGLAAYEAQAQRNLADIDTVIRAGYIAMRSPALFNAWYRFWAVGNFHGSAGLIALHYRCLETGDRSVYDAMSGAPYRRSLGTDNPRVSKMIADGAAVMQSLEAGERDEETALRDLYAVLGAQSEWIPPQFHITDAKRRHLAAFTVFPLLALIFWGKRHAPADMKAYYSVSYRFFIELTKSLWREAWRGLLTFLNVVKAAHFSRGRS